MSVDYMTGAALIATRQHVRSRAVTGKPVFYRAITVKEPSGAPRAFESDVEKVKARNCLLCSRVKTRNFLVA